MVGRGVLSSYDQEERHVDRRGSDGFHRWKPGCRLGSRKGDARSHGQMVLVLDKLLYRGRAPSRDGACCVSALGERRQLEGG